jgi:hypothetical protein
MSEVERDEILMESKRWDPKPEVEKVYGLKKNARVTYKSTSKESRHDMN